MNEEMIGTYLDLLRQDSFCDDQDILTDPADTAPYCADWRGLMQSVTPAVLRPRNTAMVQCALRHANALGIKITPQGGGTGLVFGSIPLHANEVVLSLSRMNQVISLDPGNATMTVQAGCVLDSIKQAAEDAGLLFPLSLGARGSCQIGGNLSTNAGGINVLRYGNARAQCLGIEAVLADGRIVSDLDGLRKDNRGPDLSQLIIGSEGTLGIITAAVLKLYPRPQDYLTFACAFGSATSAMDLLDGLKSTVGEQITSFEVISQPALDAVTRHSTVSRVPFGPEHQSPNFMVIGEISLFSAIEAQRDSVLESLMSAMESDANMLDVVVAQSQGERQNLWLFREEVVHCQKAVGPSIKHDVSVPLSQIPTLFDQGTKAARAVLADCVPAPFGHAGDGNLHFNISAPGGWTTQQFHAYAPAMNRAIHDLVHGLGGSYSAEHGIGSAKAGELANRLDADTYSVLQTIKQALDPNGILNPGKVFKTSA